MSDARAILLNLTSYASHIQNYKQEIEKKSVAAGPT